jgi:cellulose synthase/poly-beta-1,6-N-acetylglucosamine synthase-like glycosyltransferase
MTILLSLIWYGALCLLLGHALWRGGMALQVLRSGPGSAPTPGEASDAPPRPQVLVQLPLYNEALVVPRLLEAVGALDWPRDRLRIQVLDDSTDLTSRVVADALPRLRARGLCIDHVRRGHREGYKAGALAAGLRAAPEAEVVAILDADFVPPGDFLLRSAPALMADPRCAVVQARWGHLNRTQNALTRAQAVLLDGHFVVEQRARSERGHWLNFNGTAGLWRREAIEAAGGWQSTTLTEDLDLSYRAQNAGWRVTYLPWLEIAAELPADLGALRSQQHRWAKGGTECLRALGGMVLRSPHLHGAGRLEALVHLGANLAYPALLTVLVLAPLVASLRADGRWWTPPEVERVIWLASLASLILFHATGVIRSGPAGWRRLPAIVPALLLDMGLVVHRTRAVAEALVGHRSAFVRTPKHALVHRRSGLRASPYLHLRPLQGLPELMLALWCLGWAWSFRQGEWVDALWLTGLVGCGVGLLWTGLWEAAGWLRVHWPAGGAAVQPAPLPPGAT